MLRAIVATLLLLPILPARAEDAMTSERREAVEKVRTLLRDQDSYAVADWVRSLGDVSAVARTCGDLVFDLSQAKALPEMVAVGRAAILVLLDHAGDAGTPPEVARKCRMAARALSYNVGSFTWPGWGDPVGEAERAAGEDAARLSRRLVIELEEGASSLSVAHWLVGAHHLAAGRADPARAAFTAASGKAREAKDEAGALMNAAYLALTNVLLGSDGDAAENALADALAALAAEGSEDAAFYADQVRTARRAFAK